MGNKIVVEIDSKGRISITASQDEDVTIEHTKRTFTLILGSIEITLPAETVRKLREMLNYVLENEKVWA